MPAEGVLAGAVKTDDEPWIADASVAFLGDSYCTTATWAWSAKFRFSNRLDATHSGPGL